MLTSALKWLANPGVLPTSSRCVMVVGPDPRRFPPIPPYAGAGYRQYRLRFAAGHDGALGEVSPEFDSPFYALIENSSATLSQMRTSLPTRPALTMNTSELIYDVHDVAASNWVSLVDRESTETDQQTLQETVLDLLHAFRQYELGSSVGVEEAMMDIRRRIGALAARSGACDGIAQQNLLSYEATLPTPNPSRQSTRKPIVL